MYCSVFRFLESNKNIKLNCCGILVHELIIIISIKYTSNAMLYATQ